MNWLGRYWRWRWRRWWRIIHCGIGIWGHYTSIHTNFFFLVFFFIVVFRLYVLFVSQESIKTRWGNFVRFLPQLHWKRNEFEYLVLKRCNIDISVDFTFDNIVLIPVTKYLVHNILELFILLVPDLYLDHVVREIWNHWVLCTDSRWIICHCKQLISSNNLGTHRTQLSLIDLSHALV